MLEAIKTVLETMFRFFPFPTKTGLRVLGQPGREAPVLVTCNFDLTVRRVIQSLGGLDCYLLVAPTKGINVWCSAGGGMFNAHSVISVVKTSRIADRVDHRTLILPQLSAPGVDITRVEEATGWRCTFGPVYARDIPAYLAAGWVKSGEMRRVQFPLSDRLQMAVMWATPLSLVAAVPAAFFSVPTALGLAAMTWVFSLFLFALYPQIERFVPGPVGLVKTLLLSLLGVAGLAVYTFASDAWSGGQLVGWSLALVLVALVLGFDLDGTSPLRAGATVAYWGRKWPRTFDLWALIGYELEEWFELRVDSQRCQGCATCVAVCPKGVFDLYRTGDGSRKSRVARPEECEQCTACVKQCPERAIVADPPISVFGASPVA
ncbi:MAG: 4Fe-4S dicluster domain-containing protein [Anaerolineae bacterium]|jgi:NAD-dependent dihydropyrimidine dehydrogenase PreA subunit